MAGASFYYCPSTVPTVPLSGMALAAMQAVMLERLKKTRAYLKRERSRVHHAIYPQRVRCNNYFLLHSALGVSIISNFVANIMEEEASYLTVDSCGDTIMAMSLDF